MAAPKPTETQAAFLKACGIAVPPTKKAAWRLIGYIKMGNGTIGATQSERIAIVKATQARWLGKRVRHKQRGALGTVSYLYTETEQEVRTFRAVQPFQIKVKWDPPFTS